MKDDQIIEMLRSTLENLQVNQQATIALQEQVSELQQEWQRMKNRMLHMKADQESQSLKTKILNNRVVNYLENGMGS
ncbi:hypothetical protein LGM65_20775 [Burkholderia anthina]|uniref:hypothetical protein n=1 Tax=Burkholderia anthina TaxID=179879 RepID=UPI001CF2BF53|nr:hypothetical protein [Burkholderia anthina]MCA8093294.1 hypothetical protein [Burkholderia anthina]